MQRYQPSPQVQAELIEAGLEQFLNGIDFEDADWNAQRDYFRSHPIHAKESDAEIDDRTGYFLIWRDYGVPQDKASGNAVEAVNAKRMTVMHETLRELAREHFPALRQDLADVKNSSSLQAELVREHLPALRQDFAEVKESASIQASAAKVLGAQFSQYSDTVITAEARSLLAIRAVQSAVSANASEAHAGLEEVKTTVRDSLARIAKIIGWGLGTIFALLLALVVMTAFSLRAHAQIDVIQFQDSGGAIVKTYAAPFKIKCSTNLTCTASGSVLTMVAGTAPTAHNILSASHGDTTAAAAVRGDGIFAIGATPTWQRLAHGATTGSYFKWNGTDIVASALAASGTGSPTSCTNQAVTAFTLNADAAPTSTCSTITSAFTSGTFAPNAHNLLSATHGDTTAASPVIGDIITGQTGPVWAKLAGPIATNGVPQQLTETPSGGAAVAPVWAPAGVPTNAQVGTTYTIAATDRASYVTFSNAGAIAVTLPQAGTTGFGSNLPFIGCDIGAGTATITPTTSTISYTTGTAYTSAAATMTLATGECAWIYSDNTNYFAVKRAGGGGSLSGMTAGQVPIAATASTVTSSEALAGAGAAITTGPAASTNTDLASFSGTAGQLQDSGIASGNVSTAAAAAGAANQVVLSNAADKTLKYATADSTTTHALFATAGAPAFRAVANTDLPAITLDKSATGLANPTADATFTQPIGSTIGITLNGTAPASVATATGTNASSILVVTAPTGGADSNATGTAGVGGSPSITAGAGGAGTGTNAVGGAGGSVTLTAGAGGASLGTGVNANGGNIVLLPGVAGTGGSGTAGKTGSVQVGSSAPAPVIGTAGGSMGAEGTAPTGLAANDAWYPNATNHCFDLINQTTDIGCALGNNGTNTAGASMTLDMSAAATAAFKAPVAAGATASANGVVDYDSTNNNTHIRTNGADSLAVGEAAAVTANVILKATDSTHSLATASSISDGATAGLTSTANVLKGGNTVRLTANATAITALTPGTTVLTFGALPVSTNFSFHCAILYNQQTAAVAGTGFAVQGATNAPTRLDAWAQMYTSNAGVSAGGSVQNLATTTATSIVTGTPSAITTVFQTIIDGSVQVGASATTLNILAFTGNASDSITIQAGSYCTLTP